MPGTELVSSIETSESPVLGTLKAHKAFPRRNMRHDESMTIRPTEGAHYSLRETEPTAYTTNERIKSWIPASVPIRVVPVIGRPLTPPLNFRDNFKSWIDDAALRKREFPSKIADSETTTLLVQESPPTPESIPPKILPDVAPQASAPSSHDPPNSRTESFKTAHEDLSSEDEYGDLDPRSLHQSRQKWLRPASVSKEKRVGLGLGLESEEDDEPTPKGVTPELDKKDEEFITFNGIWGGDTPERIHDQLRQHTRKALRNNLHQTPLVQSEESPIPSKLDTHAEAMSKQTSSLREGVKLNRSMPPGASTESFTDQIQWPLKNDSCDLDAEIREVNEKRLSQASTNSTVVAAMVLDSPPKRRRTLRHTGKILDPSAVDTTPTHSNRSSMVSTRHSLRRRDRAVRSPDDDLRSSFMAETSEDVAISIAGQRNDPLVLIPDRRSSLQSSTESTKRLSKTFSVASRQQSSRPTTAPEEIKGYFEMPRRDARTVSVMIQQARPAKLEDNIDNKLASSPIPQKALSSVPTSSAISRSASVTSGGMITHFTPASPPSQCHGTMASPDIQEAHESVSDPALTGDWSSFRPRSAMVTPFSLRSAHSSTPGTLEVNEATALSIHPHTNKSILVIQEIASKDKSKPREQSAIVAANASIAIPGSSTPTIQQELLPRQIVDSPLQNPRDAPQPPEFIKVIPPTPANAPSSSEDTRLERNTLTNAKIVSAPWSSIRRAFSTRRYSESVRAPLFRTLSLRDAAEHPRFSFVENDERENRLHPEWQPRRHFNGADDSDSEREFADDRILFAQQISNRNRPSRTKSITKRITDSFRSPSGRRSQRASSVSAMSKTNTRPLPYEVVDNAIKDSRPLTRRLTGSLKLRRPQRPRQSTTSSWSNQPHYEFVSPVNNGLADKNLKGRLGQEEQAQNVGFRRLVDKLEIRREVKEEERREARRDWLRGRIGYAGPEADEESHEPRRGMERG
ncbi:MAG: hypothetical protein Q9164_001617 [Protoblastenia rupestris]